MPSKTLRIAHLSDVHMLEARPNPSRAHNLTLKFLSWGRALDAEGRVKKLRDALLAAKRSRADHYVISGDLTEVGAPAQFEAFAEALHDTGIMPETVTLVPGNHDAYTSGDAWRRALAGPLRAFAASSALEPGRLVDRGGVAFLPLDVSCYQSIARSSGELTAEAASLLALRLEDKSLAHKALVVVQHHPPFEHARGVWQWIDGLRGHARMMHLLLRHPELHVLHGHLHALVDRIAGLGKSRVFGAPATVDDHDGAPRVRLYEVHGEALEPIGLCETELPTAA